MTEGRMSPNGAPRVLAIGLDAAESSLVRRMVEAGDLPAMKALLDGGTWSRVTSPTRYSSGAVWPNFYTGQDACDHGQYGRWNWDPDQMGLAYTDAGRLTPFWQGLAEAGTTVGVLDVPFAPFVGLSRGFEVAEWGPHDRIVGRVQTSPAEVAEQVARFPSHPFADDLAAPPQGPEESLWFVDQCIEGVRLRGDLAQHLVTQVGADVTIVVFPESHHGGHFLWHTVEPDLDLYADLPPEAKPDRTLADVYREMDRQVGRLVEAAGPGTAVMVFAMHGMEPARGVPSLLEPLLEHMGLACLDSSADRRRSTLRTLKDRIPTPIRNVYRRSVPLSRRSQWGKAAVLPSYDWSRTKAFALPIEHEGHIRINLAGREARGIVPPEQYDEICDLIEAALRELSTVEGHPVVHDVVRPPRGSHRGGLPDVVPHWRREAFEAPVRIGGVDAHPFRREQSGQHSLDGFCIANGPAAAVATGETVAAEDLHRLIAAALGR